MQYVPKSADRTANYKSWEDTGRKTSVEYAKDRADEILATHKTSVLDDKNMKEIDRILKEADDYYEKRGML